MRGLVPFGIASLTAVAIGCYVAAASGVPTGLWVRNPVTWLAGALLGLLLVATGGRRTAIGFLVAAPMGLGASLWSVGQLGVHRWLDLGPLHVNAAQILLPPAIAACAVPSLSRFWPSMAATVMAFLVLQPDASQATAFGAALVVLIGQSQARRPMRLGAMAMVGVAMAAAWLRPDPLEPVPEVEGILQLAWAISPLAAVAAGGALLAAVGALASTSGAGSRALGAYGLLSAVIPLVAPFPAPLVGMAMSPILGLWLGAGLLAAQSRRTAPTSNTLAASAA